MRPVLQVITAAGAAPWIKIDELQPAFGLSFCVIPSSNATAVFKVEHTLDIASEEGAHSPVTITRVTTTATVTNDTNHGLSVADSILVQGSGDSNLDGTYQVATVASQSSYTYTVANTGAAASATARIIPLRVFTHPYVNGVSGRVDGNYAFPPRAIRVNATTLSAGYLHFIVLQQSGK